MPRFIAVSLLVGFATALPWPSPGVAETILRFRFPDGRKSTTTVKSEFQQLLTLNGKKHEVASHQELVIVSENGIRAQDGELRERLRVDSLKAKLTMPGGAILEFDSTNPNATRPRTQFSTFLDVIKSKSGTTWTIVRDKDDRVQSVDGQEKILESLDPSRREAVKRQLDLDFLRDNANQEMLRIPARPVIVGDSWDLDEWMRLEGGQNLKFKIRYTYQGERERTGTKLHQIDRRVTDVAYSIDGDASAPLKLAQSDLRAETIDGVLYFDNERGQVVETREAIRITGNVRFNLSGNELTGGVELTMSTASIVK